MSDFNVLFMQLAGAQAIWQGLAAGVFIALMNLIGALAILVIRKPSARLMDSALGFAGGVMLAASFTSLILPGIEQYGGLLPVMIGVVLGAVVLDRAGAWLPHVYRFITGRIIEDKEGGAHRSVGAAAVGAESAFGGFADRRLASMVLFIVAITLHNIPEGLAVGVAFGGGNLAAALALMLAIGIQNIPEGFAVAVTARKAGLGSGRSAAVTGIRAGLVEIPVAVAGAALVTLVEPLLPYAMGFAAGGMIYVIVDEIVPEVQANGNKRLSTFGLLAGVIVMLTLDVALV